MCVSQGSIFSLYTSQIGSIASNFNISIQQYADNAQLFFSATLNTLQAGLSNVELCLATLYFSFSHNSLTLIGLKFEAITFGTRQKL